MKPPRFAYFRPGDVDEAVQLKADYGADASALAGGQSLVPVLNFRLGQPAALIDLGGIEELASVVIRDDWVAIGAMTRQRAIERDDAVFAACAILRHTLRLVAHPAIRNRGTIGGTVAHADPAAEIPTVLAALEGTVKARGRSGERRIAAKDFFVFPLVNSLDPDEIVTGVSFPALAPAAGAAFVEYGRRHGDFALAGVAAVLTPAGDGTVATACIGLCGVAPVPVKATTVEAALVGRPATGRTWDAAGALAEALVDAEDEEQASVGYRRHLVHALVARALAQAWSRTKAAAS